MVFQSPISNYPFIVTCQHCNGQRLIKNAGRHYLCFHCDGTGLMLDPVEHLNYLRDLSADVDRETGQRLLIPWELP